MRKQPNKPTKSKKPKVKQPKSKKVTKVSKGGCLPCQQGSKLSAKQRWQVIALLYS